MFSELAIVSFVSESNRIEGIYRDPSPHEVQGLRDFLREPTVTLRNLCTVQQCFAPGADLRIREGMDVRVGGYRAPRGGPEIENRLVELIERANGGENPWRVHVDFEMLHPFIDGNGRSGRALWLWQMIFAYITTADFDEFLETGYDSSRMGFLHQFYYQTLGNMEPRG